MRHFLAIFIFLVIGFSAQAQRFVRPFATVADMIASNPADPHTTVFVGGISAEGDGGGGLFKWYSGDTTTTNTSTVFASTWPTNPVGRWIKINIDTTVPITDGFITNYTFVVVPSVSDLKNVSVTNGIQGVYVQGYSTEGDGGAGIFTYNATSTDPADDGMRIGPNNGPGMWHREIPSPLVGFPARWWGATPTNGTIQAAIDFANAAGGGRVIVPTGSWEVKSDDATKLILKNNVTLEGETGAELRIGTTVAPTSSYALITANEGTTNIQISTISLVGYKSAAPGAATNYGRLIHLIACTNVIIDQVVYADAWTDGIYLEPVGVALNDTVKIINSVPSGHNQFAINPVGVQRLHVGDRKVINIIDFGADDTGATDSTPAIAEAVRSLGVDLGGTVIIPPGEFAMNYALTNSNVEIRGHSSAVRGSAAVSMLVPWNTNSPVLSVGNDTTDQGIEAYASGNRIRDLYFYGVGPNGMGKVGFRVTGGAYKCEYHNVTSYNFAEYGTMVEGGLEQETLYHKFWNSHFEHCESGLASIFIHGGGGIPTTLTNVATVADLRANVDTAVWTGATVTALANRKFLWEPLTNTAWVLDGPYADNGTNILTSSFYATSAAMGRWVEARGSINDLSFFGCNFSGTTANTNSSALIIDGASPDLHGCWIQGRSHAGVKFKKTRQPFPRIKALGVNIEVIQFSGDTGGSVALWNDFQTNHLYGANINGLFSINDLTYFMSADGIRVDPLPGGVMDDRTMLVQPVLWDSMFFQAGTATWTNWQTEIKMGRSGSDLFWFNTLDNGDYQFIPGFNGTVTVLAITNLNALGTASQTNIARFRLQYADGGTNTWTDFIQQGNNAVIQPWKWLYVDTIPSELNDFKLGVHTTWTNASGTHTSFEAITTAKPQEDHTGTVYGSFIGLKFQGTNNFDGSPPAVVLRPYLAMLGTNQVRGDLSYILIGDPSISTNSGIETLVGVEIQSLFSGTNNFSLRTGTAPSKFSVATGFTFDPQVTVGRTTTNVLSAAGIEALVSVQAQQDDDGNYYGIYSRAETSGLMTNQIYGNGFLAGVRSEVFNRSLTNGVNSAYGYYHGAPGIAGTANFTNYYAYFTSDITTVTNGNVWGFYSAGTTHSNRFGGDTGIGTDPLVKLDVLGGFAIRTVGAADVLTSDNQTVTVGDRSYIHLSSNDTVAANRTFILSAGITVGHVVVIEYTGTGTSTGELVDDSAGVSGSHRLSATWNPTQYDTLTLGWNGTDWIERSRSTN